MDWKWVETQSNADLTSKIIWFDGDAQCDTKVAFPAHGISIPCPFENQEPLYFLELVGVDRAEYHRLSQWELTCTPRNCCCLNLKFAMAENNMVIFFFNRFHHHTADYCKPVLLRIFAYALLFLQQL